VSCVICINSVTTRNLSSHKTCSPTAGSNSTQPQQPCDCVTLTFNHLTSGSMHAEVMPECMCTAPKNSMLIAQAVFLLERKHAHRHTYTESQTPLITPSTHPLRRRRVTSSDWSTSGETLLLTRAFASKFFAGLPFYFNHQ